MWRTHTIRNQIRCLCRSQPVHTRCRMCTQAPKQEPAAKEAPPKAEASPPPPPPPPPPSGGGFGKALFRLLGLTVIGAGGVTGYAWYDQNFRKTLEDSVPYSKDVFSLVIPSDAGQKPAVSKKEPVQQGLAKVIKPDVSAVKGTEEKKPAPIEDEKTRKKREAKEKKKSEADAAKKRLQQKEDEEKSENAAIEAILKNIVSEVTAVLTSAVDAQKSAAKSTRNHSQQLKQAMDKNDKIEGKEEEWQDVSTAYEEKAKSVKQAEQQVEKARVQLEKLKAVIKEGKDNKITKKNPAIRTAEEAMSKMNYDLNTAVAEYTKAQSEAKVMTQYRDLIRKGKDQFKKELESIMPDVKLGNRFGGKLTEEELNSLIAHAHRRIEQLQRQVAEQQALETLRMQKAVDAQRVEDDKLAEGLVKREKERIQDQFSIEKEKWDIDARVGFEAELRQQLSRQAAAHSDHLAEVLQVQEKELHQKYEQLLGHKIIEERDHFQTEVAGWIARLRGIEAAVEGRADLEKQGRKAQELWLACLTLQNIVENGRVGAEVGEDQLQPLHDELAAIMQAGNNHPFVNTVIKSVPGDAVMRGVWTEESLGDRFDKVHRVCKRVALINETGGTLFKYFVSWLQSFMVFRTAKTFSESEEFDPKDLDTFMILDNAKYYMDKGDLEQALKFMNQLSGEPRRVAFDWLQEARLLLETKQAADALVAHAAASGLGSLF